MEDMEARVADLEVQVIALRRLVIGLALAAPDKAAFDTVAAMAELAQVHAGAKYGEQVGNAMADITTELRTMSRHGLPLAVLLSEALLYGQAGDALRAPLQSWLAIAHPEEIADDLLQALRSAAPEGGGQSGDG